MSRTVIVHGGAVLIDGAAFANLLDLTFRALEDVNELGDLVLANELRHALGDVGNGLIVAP